MTDKDYMKIGVLVFKIALISFSVGVFVGWLIFKQ